MPTVNLTNVLITDQLQLRNSRAPNLTSENDALHRLALHVTKPGDQLLEELLTTALRICEAGTAGVSAFDVRDPHIVRWITIVGRLALLTGGTAPLAASACGFTIAAEKPQLFSRPTEYLRSRRRSRLRSLKRSSFRSCLRRRSTARSGSCPTPKSTASTWKTCGSWSRSRHSRRWRAGRSGCRVVRAVEATFRGRTQLPRPNLPSNTVGVARPFRRLG